MTPTPKLNPADFAGLGSPELVYVREVIAGDVLTDALREEAPHLNIGPGQTLYAVHRADGERLAIMLDRETAFAAAFAHELEPVSVH